MLVDPMLMLQPDVPMLPIHNTEPLELHTAKYPAVPVATALTADVVLRVAEPALAVANAVLPRLIVANSVPVRDELPFEG